MPVTDERTIALCLEIADRLRAAAADDGEDLTPAERRENPNMNITLTSFGELTDGWRPSYTFSEDGRIMTTLARDIAEQIASSPEGFDSAMDRVRHWTREGLLNLVGDPNPGRGKKRYYDEKALTFARVLNAMANAGFEISKLKMVTAENTIGNILDTVWMMRDHMARKDDYRYYITIHYGPRYGLKGEAIMEMPNGIFRDRASISEDTEMAIVINLSAILR